MDGGAFDRLKKHRWPGNVRELENMVRRLAALYPQDTITDVLVDAELAEVEAAPSVGGDGDQKTPLNLMESVEFHLGVYFSNFKGQLPPPGLYHRILRDVEEPLINAALIATRGNQIKAAELLGVNRNTLRKKIRDLDIKIMRSVH